MLEYLEVKSILGYFSRHFREAQGVPGGAIFASRLPSGTWFGRSTTLANVALTRRGTIRNDMGGFLILAHEKSNEIKDLNASSATTTILIDQWLTEWVATRTEMDWLQPAARESCEAVSVQ